jgi:hypothetical protein
MPIFKNSRIIFVHIPKSGGHSIEKAFGIKHKSFSEYDFSMDKLFGRELQHLSLKEIDAIICNIHDICQIRVFTIFRDPVQRLISEYNWSGPWASVEEFENERLENKFQKYAEDLSCRHLAPQHFFIQKGKNLAVNEIFLMGESNLITKTYALKKIPTSNSSEKRAIKNISKFKPIVEKYYQTDMDLFQNFKVLTPKKRAEYFYSCMQNVDSNDILKKSSIKKTDDDSVLFGKKFEDFRFLTEKYWRPSSEKYLNFLFQIEHGEMPAELSSEKDIRDFFINLPLDCRRNLFASTVRKSGIFKWFRLCVFLSNNHNLPKTKIRPVETFLTNNFIRIIRRFRNVISIKNKKNIKPILIK